MTSIVESTVVGLGRHTWIVGALSVAVCAALAARAANDLIEARYLDERTVSPSPPRVQRAPDAQPARRSSSARADLLVDRNMFCSDCGARSGPDDPPSVTSLPLVLVATYLGVEPAATIRNNASGRQGAYGVGDLLPGVGRLEHVAGTYVLVRNDGNGRTERLQLLAPPTASAQTAPEAPKVAAAWADQVRAIDDTTFEVDRALVRELIGSGGTGDKVKGVKIVPAIKDGKVAGIRVIQARSGSLAAAIGLRPGDVIEVIDGVELRSADQILGLVTRVDTATRLAISGRRGSGPLRLEYRLH